MSSFFVGIENAKASEKLPNITEGQYLLQVDALKAFRSRSGVPFLAGEYTVIESQGAGAISPGARCSHLIKLSLDSALGNVQNLVAALLGVEPKSVTQSQTDKLVSSDINPNPSPAIGSKVKADAFVVPKKNGDPFTRVSYSAYQNVSATAAPAAGETSSTKGKGK